MIRKYFSSKVIKRQEILKRYLDELEKNLFKTYFENSSAKDAPGKRQLLKQLEDRIATSVFETPPKNRIEALLANFRSQSEHYYNDEFDFLKHVFLPSQSSKQLPKLNRLYKDQCEAVGFALQNTIFAVPNYSYSGIYPVPDDVVKSLVEKLKYIDTIRQQYQLQALLPFNYTCTKLYQEIARVDDRVFFPLKRLPTASLDAKELLEFCVRRDNLINNMARHIMKNDGVMLVAGYRGVGKSTFVNAVIEKLSDLAQFQAETEQCRIIPIQISVAKTSSPLHILRLCIRAIYDKFLAEEVRTPGTDLAQLLDKHDEDLMKWANLCAMHKVDSTWTENVASLRSIEASLELKPGDLLPKPLGSALIGKLLPSIGTKSNKEWSKRIGHSVALLDYDEDRAEEDILRIIETLSEPSKHRKTRFRFVFVFDELDKLDRLDIDTLVKKLKNLFLARHAVFILVTGKEFYYDWLKEQKQEDSILSSYFSSVEMVPLFTSAETTELLKKLCVDNQTIDLEQGFIQILARYLTYRAQGIPREIIRELQKLQQWVPESLQSYITTSADQRDAFQVYADVQLSIEGVVNDEPHDEWREQIERGLHILIEEIFSLERMNLDAEEAGVLKEIHKRNFSLVPLDRFKKLIERLSSRLQTVLVKDVSNSSGKVPLFSLESLDSNEGDTLIVARAFYKLTGHAISDTSSEQSLRLSVNEIETRLSQGRLSSWKEAFNALKNIQAPLDELYSRLYAIFVLEENIPNFSPDQVKGFRRSAATYLQKSNTFFSNLAKRPPDQFILIETDEQLVNDFMQLLQQGITSEERSTGMILLLGLLNRCRLDVGKKNNRIALQLSRGTFTDLISILSTIAEDDILEQVLKSLDPKQEIAYLLPALLLLEKKSHQRVIDILISLDFPIDRASLQNLLSEYKDENEIWSFAILHRLHSSLACWVMTLIARQWSLMLIEQSTLQSWLDSSSWDENRDQFVLDNTVTVQNYDYFETLMSTVSDQAKARLTKVLWAKTSTSPLLYAGNPVSKTMPGTTTHAGVVTSTGSNRLPGWVIFLTMMIILIIYFVVPVDNPPHTNFFWGQVMRRLCEAVFIYGLFCLIAAWGTKAGRKTSILLLLITLGALLLLVFLFPLAITFGGQVLLIGLLIVFWAPLVFDSIRATT